MLNDNDDIILTGIKPSGEMHLGGYLGVILPLIKLQEEYNNLFVFIADIHALTKPILAKDLRRYTEDLIAIYLAAGLNPERCTIFRQSSVPAHAQLSQILTCYLNVADLTKMPQYKNYIATHPGEAVPAGMLDYVNWMNADIALYSPEINTKAKLLVPCGEDQLPHVYLCQEVLRRFNKLYGEAFKLPEPITQKVGAKIMSLTNPTKKMSKSESDAGTIYLLEDAEISKKKIMKAVTDSDNIVKYDPENKPGVSNLMTILSCLTGESFDSIEARYSALKYPYGPFKKEIAETLGNELSKIQTKVAEIKASGQLATILSAGATVANCIANKKIQKIYSEIGLN